MAELLLEIGLEEIPARMIGGAEQELARRVQALVQRERLGDGEQLIRTYSTPRRLAVSVGGVAMQQAPLAQQLTGPAWNVAFKDGAPGPAALAFAKKAGVSIEALTRVTTSKGEYVGATVDHPGRSAAAVLADELPKEIAAIGWPKNMYWRPGKPERYVRPIQWILALLDHAILPVEFAGVHAANLSYGHRILHGTHALTIEHPEDYAARLAGARVMVSAEERRQSIRKALDNATRGVPGARWREDQALVEAVVHLTEWPAVILGSFQPEFLALPEEVLVTVMRDHQKYFAIEDAEGKLTPYFLAVLNTEADSTGIIRHGNERVLRARFNDARFFWNFDGKTTLDQRVELLRKVTFQKDLGNYYEKTERIREVAGRLAFGLSERGIAIDANALDRAAQLAKVDLTTEMVKEFTELQGIVGGLYARRSGESEEVSGAIYAQYQPASGSDPIPVSVEGQLLGMADRITTIHDMFAIGFAPTGSKDPYALRRAANAIVRILAETGLPLSLDALFTAARGEKAPDLDHLQQLADFFYERLEFYLRDVLGFAFDVVNAVLRAGSDQVADAVARARAVAAVRDAEDFAAISAAFKRSKNILRQATEKTAGKANGKTNEAGAPGGADAAPDFAREPQMSLLADPAEHSLYQVAVELGPRVRTLREERNYPAALEQIAGLRGPVDRFFDQVMVMVEDRAVRENRLALLALIVREFSTLADFSEIVPRGTS